MRSFLQNGCVLLLPLLAAGCLIIGCRSESRPGGTSVPPSVTVPANVTAPPAVALPPPVVPTETDGEEAGEDAAPAPSAAGNAMTRPAPAEKAAATEVAALNLVPIDVDLPAPAFRGTPVPMEEPNVEKPRGGPRPPFLAPEGTVNLARGKPVVAGDPMPVAGELDYVTDGNKEASDFGCLELHPGSEWIQVDLGQTAAVYAVLVWHNHAEARVYRDVIVQVSDDPDFLDCQTIFNNDYDNSSGMGIGRDMGYVETSEGKLVDAKGVEGRYVRLYSNGNHVDGKNHYTEVEVFGRPAQ